MSRKTKTPEIFNLCDSSDDESSTPPPKKTKVKEIINVDVDGGEDTTTKTINVRNVKRNASSTSISPTPAKKKKRKEDASQLKSSGNGLFGSNSFLHLVGVYCDLLYVIYC